MTESKDPSERVRGIEGLASKSSVEHLDAILLGLHDPNSRVRDAAAKALHGFDPDLVCRRTIALLCSADRTRRDRLAQSLPALTDMLETPMCAVLQSDTSPDASRQAAAYCLGIMGSRMATEPLARAAWSPNSALAVISAQALADIGDPGAGPHFVKLIKHPHADARIAAMRGLVRVNDPKVATMLAEAALNPEEESLTVRREAVTLLGSVNPQESVPLLIHIMQRNLGVRRQAALALVRLTGQNFGEEPDAWQSWYENLVKTTGGRIPSPAQLPRVPGIEIEFNNAP